MNQQEIDQLWKERVLYSDGGDPIIFKMHFESAINQAAAAAYDGASREIQSIIRCADGIDRLKLKNRFDALGKKLADKARELR